MLTTARLQQASAPVRPAQAWLLPGADPAAWLAEVCSWPGSTAGVRFFPLAEPGTATVVGTLALPAQAMVLPAGARAQAYGELAPGCYAPVDAVLAPPLAFAELPCAAGVVQVFHPALGLHRFEAAAARDAADLLFVARAEPEQWNRAVAAPAAPPRLRSVRLLSPPPLAEVFGKESEDIGSEPFTKLPPAPGEKDAGTLSRLGAGAAELAFRGVSGAFELIPRSTGASPNWINHLETWLLSKLVGYTEDVEASRHRELERLMKLLEENPLEGLRHAISLAQLANRGKAPPGGSLARRELNFDLSRLGGGHAADFWDIPAQIQNDLAKRYRENAEREARLGHHRRAAYIYGELLGDLAAAAGVLKAGRHYREAALLYRERLRNPMLAAECLMEGGLLDEAAEIYEMHSEWLLLADLRERQGRPEEARTALRKLVGQHRDRRDLLAAARVLEKRLGEKEEALGVLASGWPHGAQALMCLEERFALLGRLERHAEVPPLIAALAGERLPGQQETDLVGLLARIAEETRRAEVRDVAAETVRRKISTALVEDGIDRSQQTSLLRALTRLEPADRLLARDVMRFRKGTRPEPALPPPLSDTRLIPRFKPTLVRTLPGTDLGPWLRFASDAQGFCGVLRSYSACLVFTRGLWRDNVESEKVEWPDPAENKEAPLLWSVGEMSVILGRPFAEPLKIRIFPATDAYDGRQGRVGTFDWIPRDTVQVARGQEVTWNVRLVGERVVLGAYQANQTIHSEDVTAEIMAAGTEMGAAGVWLSVLDSPGRVALGYGNCVLLQEGAKTLKAHALSGRVTGLFPGPSALPGWVVALERGAVFLAAGDGRLTTLDESMEKPQAARLLDDRIVLVGGDGEGKVFQVVAGNLAPAGWFEVPDTALPCAGVGPANGADLLAICHVSGRVGIWRVPVR